MVRARSGDKEVQDVNLSGESANMADIDTRTVEFGRYFTATEAEHKADDLPDRRHAGAAIISGRGPRREDRFASATMS